jgi:hypothetical protein
MPPVPAPSNLTFQGGSFCTGTATLNDHSGILYVFQFFYSC